MARTSAAFFSLLALFLLVIPCLSAPVPLNDDVSSTLQQLVAEMEQQSTSERELNQCFAQAYGFMVKGAARGRGAEGAWRVAGLPNTRAIPLRNAPHPLAPMQTAAAPSTSLASAGWRCTLRTATWSTAGARPSPAPRSRRRAHALPRWTRAPLLSTPPTRATSTCCATRLSPRCGAPRRRGGGERGAGTRRVRAPRDGAAAGRAA